MAKQNVFESTILNAFERSLKVILDYCVYNVVAVKNGTIVLRSKNATKIIRADELKKFFRVTPEGLWYNSYFTTSGQRKWTPVKAVA